MMRFGVRGGGWRTELVRAAVLEEMEVCFESGEVFRAE
jgi:hypothetical protein